MVKVAGVWIMPAMCPVGLKIKGVGEEGEEAVGVLNLRVGVGLFWGEGGGDGRWVVGEKRWGEEGDLGC